MERAAARLWREGTRWVIQVEIDGVHYTEGDYASVAGASHAIASILRQCGERTTDLDEAECAACDEPLDLLTCSQCPTFVPGDLNHHEVLGPPDVQVVR